MHMITLLLVLVVFAVPVVAVSQSTAPSEAVKPVEAQQGKGIAIQLPGGLLNLTVVAAAVTAVASLISALVSAWTTRLVERLKIEGARDLEADKSIRDYRSKQVQDLRDELDRLVQDGWALTLKLRDIAIPPIDNSPHDYPQELEILIGSFQDANIAKHPRLVMRERLRGVTSEALDNAVEVFLKELASFRRHVQRLLGQERSALLEKVLELSRDLHKLNRAGHSAVGEINKYVYGPRALNT